MVVSVAGTCAGRCWRSRSGGVDGVGGHGLELFDVAGVLDEVGCGDEVVAAGGELGVVALDEPFAGGHEPGVRVGAVALHRRGKAAAAPAEAAVLAGFADLHRPLDGVFSGVFSGVRVGEGALGFADVAVFGSVLVEIAGESGLGDLDLGAPAGFVPGPDQVGAGRRGTAACRVPLRTVRRPGLFGIEFLQAPPQPHGPLGPTRGAAPAPVGGFVTPTVTEHGRPLRRRPARPARPTRATVVT